MKSLKQIFFVAILLLAVIILRKDDSKSTNTFYKTTTGLNVRTGTGNKNPISFVLQKGDVVEIIDKKSGWYKIKYDNKTGYAHPKFLIKQDEATFDSNITYTPQIKSLLLLAAISISIILAIPLGLKLYRKIKNNRLLKTVTELNRGTPSERDLVLKLLKYGIQNNYIFHDLSLEVAIDRFSQIDVIAVVEVGIIVFEVKDYSGWIYGNGDKPEWTKALAYGREKYRFQNPIIQNRNHINNLKNTLGEYRAIPIYSVIVFYGNCVLKNVNFVPQQTFITRSERIRDVLHTISNHNQIYEYKNKNDVIEILRNATIYGGNKEIQNQHIANVRDMLGKDRIFD